MKTPELMMKNEATLANWKRLEKALSGLKGVNIQEKKTSLHLDAGKSAFLGVHPRKDGLRINIVLNRALKDKRVVRSEATSKSVFHNEVDVMSASDFDKDFVSWVKEAYELRKV